MTDRTYKILLVDDSDSDRALVDLFLNRSKIYRFTIEQVDSPMLGLERITSNGYDCVLVDYNMPEMSGIDFINQLRSIPENHGDLPIALVLLTGQGDESIAVEAIRLGAEDYLIKDRLHNGILPRAIVKAIESYELRCREKKAASSLADNERVLRLMAETIPQLIWMSEPDGRTSYVNQRFADFSGLDAGGINFSAPELHALIHPDDRQAAKRSWETAMRLQEPYTAEIRMRKHDGQDWRWYLCRSEPVMDAEGNLVNWFGTCTDVHVLRETQQELFDREDRLQKINEELNTSRDLALAANRAKSVFLASMSHEFRTPLNAVIGYSEMLADEADELGEAQQSKDLNRIRSAARHLLSLIDDVLDLARIEAGEMSVNIKRVDLSEIVWDSITTAQWLIEKNNNSLKVDIPKHTHFPVFGDPTRIRQIVFNLLSNAAKFTEGGELVISITTDTGESDTPNAPQMVRVSVSDTGIGMDEEKARNLFQPFYQGDNLITERYGGTGLGLAISRNLCRMMNGDITVSSEMGEGSTFAMLLPLATAEKNAPVRS